MKKNLLKKNFQNIYSGKYMLQINKDEFNS